MINFGDKNIYVTYLQLFLKENYNYDLIISDEYDIDTHRTLIKYLKEPEIIDCYELKDLILRFYTYRNSDPPHELIDGGGIWNFNFDISPEYIRFFNRDISDCLTGGLKFITEHIESLKSFCDQYGWNITYYTTYSYDETGEIPKAEIVIKKTARKQLLPCRDIINMINLSLNQFLSNKCFLDNLHSYHGYIQNSDTYSILCVEALPGDSFTISHAFNESCEMAIGYSSHSFEELKIMDSTVNDIQDNLYNSTLGEIKKGKYVTYSIPITSDCKTLLIQINNKKHKHIQNKILVMHGDIEFNNPNNELNIPIEEYNDNPWCIHDEFLSYLFGSVIHKYSNPEDIEWLQKNINIWNPEYIQIRPGKYDSASDYVLNEYMAWDSDISAYRYIKNSLNTGYILDSDDILNGYLVDEKELQKTPLQIKNGKFLLHDKLTGAMVLSSGFITKENAYNSLKQIIKRFQIASNKLFKHNSKEQIKFINGYVNPLTEKRLISITNNNIDY